MAVAPEVNNPAVAPTEPWRPAAQLVTPQRPGWRRRWVRKDLLDRKMAEGWQPVREKDQTEKTIIDGFQLGSYVSKRNLILCEMPEERAKQRDAYFKQQTDASDKQAVAQYKGKFANKETYGGATKEDPDEV